MTTLRDASLALEQRVNDKLGDEITYTFAAGGAPLTFNAWIEFDTTVLGMESSAGAVDEILVEVPMDKVPNPVVADRIAVTLLPGMVWAFKNKRRSSTGVVWILPLKRATA